MALDASIYSQVRAPQAPDILGQYAQAQQLQGQVQQNRLLDMRMMDAQREQEHNRLLGDAYKGAIGPDGTINRQALYGTVAQSGLGAKLPGIQEGFAKQDKEKAMARKAEIEAAQQRLTVSGQIMNGVTDQATWDRARQQAAEAFGPEAAAQLPPQYDPALIEQKRRQALTVAQQFEQEWKKLDHDLNTQKFGETVRHNKSTETISVDNNKRSVGAQYAIAGATRDAAKETASATRDAAKIKDTRDTEMKLADDYRAQSKPFKEVGDAYKQINATLDQATKSPAATLAAATKFMKLLDPGSVVRESELGMALQASGVIDRLTNYHNTLLKGKVLTIQQAADFKNITGKIYQAAQQQQQAIDGNYKNQAKQYGLRPEMIVQDLGQDAKTAPAPAGAPKAGTVQDGYRFKGGNPADPKSWEKV